MNCLSTGIGSLPFRNARTACDFVLEYCSNIPFWPQLPNRDKNENMYLMFTEFLPGIVNDNGRVYLDSTKIGLIEEFYNDLIKNPNREFVVSENYSAAIHDFLTRDFQNISAIKGHVTGPVSFGLQLNDENGKPVLYNKLLMDVIVKTLAGIIRWQEKRLSELCDEVLLLIDEPYMSLLGSSIFSLNQKIIQNWINELVANCNSKIGLHCCANTDWSFILNTNAQIISFDAYEYANNFLLYRKQLAAFLKRGGIIAWGIVPTSAEQVAVEDIESLFTKFEKRVAKLEEITQISRDSILQSSLITPACGLGARDERTATVVFQLTRDLSDKIRQVYSLR